MNQKPTRYFSKQQENSVASATGGKRVCNSGATRFAKGDCLTDDFLLECKTSVTSKKSISICREWFEKNDREKRVMGKQYSAVVFNFGPKEPNYYAINEELFLQLQEYLAGQEG